MCSHRMPRFAAWRRRNGLVAFPGWAGGGMRYQSKSFNQRDVTTGRDYWGEPILQFDLLVGYRKRLAKFYANRPMDLSIQLNITNLLDDAEPLVGRLNNFYNAPRRLYLQEPRNFRLTTTFSL